MTRESERPSPPTDLDRDVREALAILEAEDADRLRAVGGYLEDLAAWKASNDGQERPRERRRTAGHEPPTAGSGDGDDAGNGTDQAVDGDDVDYPDDVPERASVTVKEIAGTTYYYYQWRDGDRIESKTVQR